MTVDLFAALAIPRRFDMDISDLEKRYFAAQRQVHPDRFVGKSAHERAQTALRSILINDAYETLKSPLKRARHMLALAGIAFETLKPSQTLLVENMEMREILEGAKTLESLQKIMLANENTKLETIKLLSQHFEKSDFSGASESTVRLSYLMKMEDEIVNKSKV